MPHVPLPEAICALAAEAPGSVLLETSKFDDENYKSYLFCNPIRVLRANSPEELILLFRQIEEVLKAGCFVAGFLAYEAGYVLQELPYDQATTPHSPLAWFGVFNEPIYFDHVLGTFCGAPLPALPSAPSQVALFSPEELSLDITPERYEKKIEQIKAHIAAGATYQINFTNQIQLCTKASPAELYLTLSRKQPVSYSAFINTGSEHVLSLSPELFFRTCNRRIITRPMKGTWPRGRDTAEDIIAALELQNDEKNRSEHLMIVDLLRNDLGRICATGSIHVDDLFSVEHYQTLLQMTSTISGILPERLPWIDVFRSLFPSGSITGAPKLSSIDIIRDMEDAPRGIYTGSIGYITPTGDATFNVAIRTLVHKDGQIKMGVGGGIVVDSNAATEHAECRLKASFLAHSPTHELIETMRWDSTFIRLDLHLNRLKQSCEYFGFPFDAEQILAKLEDISITFYPLSRYRVRLTLDRYGQIKLSSAPMLSVSDTCRVTLATEHTISSNMYLRHKTTHRTLYDRSLSIAQANGFDEVLFLNERNELTEGAISNIFLRNGSKLYTPPLASGVLPGVFRRQLLDTIATTEERVLTLDDLRNVDAIYLCNSLRGMRRVTQMDID